MASELMRRNLLTYIQGTRGVPGAWDFFHPGQPYRTSYATEAITEHLQAVSNGEIDKLIVNCPPGHTKSLSVCVFWPTWEWARNGRLQGLYGSYDRMLALRDATRSRDLMGSLWYRNLFHPSWQFNRRQDSKGFYTNTLAGHRFSFGMRSRFQAGWRGDRIVVDDPISVEDRFSRQVKDDAYTTFNVTLTTRVNDPVRAVFVVAGHRIADDDLFGRLIPEGGWTVLRLPSEYDARRSCVTMLGTRTWRSDGSVAVERGTRPWRDRREPGDLLFPALYPRTHLQWLRDVKLGAVDYDAQFQQEPHPEAGARFRPERFLHWRRSSGTTVELCRRDGSVALVRLDLCRFLASVDVAVGEDAANDYTCYLLWALTNDRELILLDRRKDRWSEPESIQQAIHLHQWRGHGDRRIAEFAVESAGVGKPLCQQLRVAGLPVVEVKVTRDKVARSGTAIVWIENGKIFFPDPRTTPWYADFEAVLVAFPFGAHDDDVDAVSVAAERVYGDDRCEVRQEPATSSPAAPAAASAINPTQVHRSGSQTLARFSKRK